MLSIHLACLFSTCGLGLIPMTSMLTFSVECTETKLGQAVYVVDGAHHVNCLSRLSLRALHTRQLVRHTRHGVQRRQKRLATHMDSHGWREWLSLTSQYPCKSGAGLRCTTTAETFPVWTSPEVAVNATEANIESRQIHWTHMERDLTPEVCSMPSICNTSNPKFDLVPFPICKDV